MSNSYIQMAVAEEEIASSKLFFTDKRLYLQEKYFSLRHGKETKNVIVPLDEISGTQITHESPVHYFIWGGLYLLISLVLGILKASDGHGQEPGILMIVSGFFVFGIFTILFFLRRGTYFHISFPGNTLSTSVRMYSYQVIFAFQKGLQQFMKKAK